MSDNRETPDSAFRGLDDFPMLDGERRCSRCRDNCCTVSVGPYDWWAEFVGPLNPKIGSPSPLRPEPSGSGDEAWFCMGGCDKKGKHSDYYNGPSFIARVKKTGDG